MTRHVSGPHDPVAARNWRTVSGLLFGASTVALGIALGYLLSEWMVSGRWVFTVPMALALLAAGVCAVLGVLSVAFAMHAIDGPPDDIADAAIRDARSGEGPS